MTIPFNTSQGYFQRVGAIEGEFLADIARMGENAPVPSNATLKGYAVKGVGNGTTYIRSFFTSTNLDVLDGQFAALAERRTAVSGYLSYLQGLHETVAIEMANSDVTLVSKDKATAIHEIDRQMRANSQTIKANVVSSSVAAVSGNTGDTRIACNVTSPKGVNREYVFAETVDVVVNSDVGRGGTAGSETASATGEPAASTFDWNWPLGSGASASLTVTDPAQDASQNLLTNSDFEDFTAGIPDSWTVITGSNATIGSSGTSYIPGGSTSLKFIGNGTAVQTIKQTFDDGVLEPNKVYGVWAAIQLANASGNGTVGISLVNNTTLAVLTDDASTANTLSMPMSSENASWNGNHTFFFRTAKVLPTAGVAILINTTTPSNTTIYLQAAMCEATELYTGGPYLAAFRGSVDPIVGDKWEVTVSNDWGGKLQTMHDRLLDMKGMDEQLPSAASPTINETLVA